MNKLTRQLLSLFMCVLMVIESGFNAGITGYATENKSGGHISVYAVKALASLPEDVAYQAVEYGTPENKLNLPKTIFALACDERSMQEESEEESEEKVYVASLSETEDEDDATQSEISVSDSSDTDTATESEIEVITNYNPEFMTGEQKDAIVELLSNEEKPSIKELENVSGLDLDGYQVIKLPLTWESDTSFGGYYNPEEPGVYSFVSEVSDESKYVLYDSALPTVSIEVLEENCEAFLATWKDEDEDLEITVSAPAGTFPNDAVLKVEKIKDENDTLKIDEAVEKTLDNDKSVKQSLSYDIKVVDPEGKELKPVTAGGKKVDVTFKSQAIKDASLDEDQYVSVYHFKDVDKDDVEKAAKAEDADESMVDVVLDALSSIVSDKNTGDKLEKPEQIKAEEPEEALEAESSDSTEDDQIKEEKKAPESDDSEKVSEEGGLKVKTTDFSVFTIAIYANTSPVKAYYVTLTNKEGSKYVYEDGDILSIEFTGTADDELSGSTKTVVFYTGEDFTDKFVKKVSEDPTNLQSLLENSASPVSALEVPANVGTFGIVADSDGISVKKDKDANFLIRNGNKYPVTIDEREMGSTEAFTNKGIYWEPDESLFYQTYYVEQTVEGIDGEIKYDLSGFGSDGGKATVSVIDKNGVTRTLDAVTTDQDTVTVTVEASDKSFTIISADDLSIKPQDSEKYSYTPDNGGVAQPISKEESEPTKFTFTTRNHVYVINQSVNYPEDDDVVKASKKDAISYNLSNLKAGETVTLRIQEGEDPENVKEETKTVSGEGKLSFDIKADIASFSIISKKAGVVLDNAVNSSESVNNLILSSGSSVSSFGETAPVELEFSVPKFKIEFYNVLYKDDGTERGAERLENTAEKTIYTINLGGDGLKESKNLDNPEVVNELFDVKDYRYKRATIKIGDDEHSVSEISNSQYVSEGTTYDIKGDVTLKLYYAELVKYPLYIETEELAKGKTVTLDISGIDNNSIVKVYLLDNNKTKVINTEKELTGDGSYSFDIADTSKYYLMIESDDIDRKLTLKVDASVENLQQHAGVGVDVDAIELKTRASDTDYEGNKLLLEAYKNNYPLIKRWEDGGKNQTEKNKFVGEDGKDVAEYMYLQYKIADTIEGVEGSGSWQELTTDAMKNILGYRAEEVSETALTPKDATFNYTGPTSYIYYFESKLYSKYVYRDALGEIRTSDIKYRIAEKDEIKTKYYSKYENEDQVDTEDGTVLRNYEIKTYTATVQWNDKDAVKDSNGTNLDRPSMQTWLNSIEVHKVLGGNKNDAATMSFIPGEYGEEDGKTVITGTSSNDYETIKVIDNKDDTWTVEIRGYGYDKDDYDVHYYITQNLPKLAETDAKAGNHIVNRRYQPEFDNKGSAANETERLYKNGTLINVLSGDTKYTMYKLWKDEGDVDKRPTAQVIIYRYTGEGEDSLRHLSPIQSEDYHKIEKNMNIGTAEQGNYEKLYKLTIPSADNSYVAAYNGDGTEFKYVGKENMTDTSGKNTYVTTLRYKTEVNGKKEGPLHEGHFIYDGETLVNLITGTVNVKATKIWKAKAKQDVESIVGLELKQKDYEGNTVVASTSELKDFSSEQTEKSHSWSMPKYDNEGHRYYYSVEEKYLKTIVDGRPEDATLVPNEEEGEGGSKSKYFVTADGYRYKQSISYLGNDDDNIDMEITNTLVGNAQVMLVKTFPEGLSKENNTTGVTLHFDVFQNKTKIGTITRDYKVGGKLGKLNDDGTISYTEISTLSQLTDKVNGFSDVIIVDRYEDTEYFKRENSEFSGLLPRYTNDGAEYTYSIFEHQEAVNQGYYPTMVNEITEPVYKISSPSAIHPYEAGKDKYLLDTVTISNATGKDSYITVYKEWLDGEDSDSREAVEFVFEYQAPGSVVWETLVDSNKIDPTALKHQDKYSKYVFVTIPEDYITKYKAFKENGFKATSTSGSFRVRETKLGNAEVHYYTGSEGTIVNDFGEVHYLGHDWDKYNCDPEKFASLNDYENDDYGFVQGKTYDYDVLLVNSASAGEKYMGYSHNEYGNIIGNRDFDFALSNRRVGVIYVDIEKTWKDGDNRLGHRPEAIRVKVKIGDDEELITLNKDADGRYRARRGPFRKYDSKGDPINYNPHLVEVDTDSDSGYYEKKPNAYEVFLYPATDEAKADADEYFDDYSRSGDTVAVLHASNDHHTGDVYSIGIHNELTGSLTPVVNKFWEDYEEGEKENKRPDIYANIYRSYTDVNNVYHIEQIDKTNYVDYDWKTDIDHKTHNWWQVKYSPLPRYSKNYEEYSYYIGETYPSANTNEYTEIGAFPDSPKFKDETHQYATYDYKDKKAETIKLSEDGPLIYAAKVTKDIDKAGTLVNSPRSKRTVNGVKIYNNLPIGFVAANLPDITIQLWRKTYAGDIDERVTKYTEVYNEDFHNYELKPVASTSYLNTVLKGADAFYKRQFYFYNSEEDKAEDKQSQVPKYDNTGRPYTYYIKEDATQSDILKAVYDFTVDDTLTNGIKATNAYKPTKNYSITFRKEWTGYNPDTGTYDKEYLTKYLNETSHTPRITIRLYRYLQDEKGNIIPGTEELVADRTVEGKQEIAYYNQDTKKYTAFNAQGAAYTLTETRNFKTEHEIKYKDPTHVYTWDDLEYYAPNLRPYKYVISEKFETNTHTINNSQGYEEVYEGTFTDTTSDLIWVPGNLYDPNKKENDKYKHKDGWIGYDITVKGDYTLPKDGQSGHGSGTAGIINVFTKRRTKLKVKKDWIIPEKYNFDGINLIPDTVYFKLYVRKNSGIEHSVDAYVDTIPISKNEIEGKAEDGHYWATKDWETVVNDLLYYEPRGYKYRYYIEEDLDLLPIVVTNPNPNVDPDQNPDEYPKVDNSPFVAKYPNPDKAEDTNPQDKPYIFMLNKHDESIKTVGINNNLKTISLYVTKDFKDSGTGDGIEPGQLKTLYKLGVIPDEIKYQVYYQVQDGKSDTKWLPLKKGGNPVMMDQTSKFDQDKGTYDKVGKTGLLPYTYTDYYDKETQQTTKKFVEVKYRAVEYSVKYKDDPNEIIRSTDSIDAELGYKDGSSGFAGFTAVSSTDPVTAWTTGNTKYAQPYSLNTTVTNTLDLTQLQVEKTWDDEAREFGSKIKSISFKLQRRLKGSTDYADWDDVTINGVKTIERTASAKKQTATFDNLPLKDKNGNEYEYRAVETKIVVYSKNEKGEIVETEVTVLIDKVDGVILDDGESGNQKGGTKAYAYESTNSELSGYGIYSKVYKTVFKNTLRLGEIVVTKNWKDSGDKYKKRPDDIRVELISSVELQTDFTPSIFSGIPSYNLGPKTLESPNWTASWSQLPLYDADDKPITYTLNEYIVIGDKKSVINSYDATYLIKTSDSERTDEGDDNKYDAEGITVDDKVPTRVTFTNTIATTSFIVEKKWDTDDEDKTLTNKDYRRFVHVELQSHIDDEVDSEGKDKWDSVEIYADSEGNQLPESRVLTATLYDRLSQEEFNHYKAKWNDLSDLDQYKARWDDLPEKTKDGRKIWYRAEEKSITIYRTVLVNGQEVIDEDTEVTRDVTLDSDRMNRNKTESKLYYVGGYNYDEEFSRESDDVQAEYLHNVLKKGGYSITKVWDDDNNRDGIRPDEVTFQLQRKLGDGEWTTLDPKTFERTITNQTEAGVGAWSRATWSELPVKDPNGESYSYRAVETPVPSGYEFRAEKGELTWYEAIIEGINSIYHWVYTFITNLLNGTDTVAESVSVDEGTVIYEDAQMVRAYTNIHSITTVDVSATKKWADNDDKYGDRPKEITVTLYQSYVDAEGEVHEEKATRSELANGVDEEIKNDVILSDANNWTVTWTGLPQYKRGLKRATVSYIVRESVNDNYTGETTTSEETDENGKKTYKITITNTLNPTNIFVRKNWENEYSGIGKSVTGAEVVLQRKTEATDWTNVYETVNGQRSVVTRVISKPETSITIDDLPVADKNGKVYQYRAVESRIYLSDGSVVNAKANAKDITSGTVGAYVYSSVDSEIEMGFSTDITNRMDTASLKVSKTWNDEDNKNNKRPENLKITLKASTVTDGNVTDITVDGLKTETILNAGNNWTDDTTWKTVPVYTADGKRIHYTFTEESITSYNSAYKSVSYGAAEVTGDGVTAARVYTETDHVSEVTFINSYSSGNGGGGGGNGGGGGDGGSGGGDTPGGSDSTDDGEVLGGNRPLPDEPEVLGGTRPLPQTGDDSNMMLYGLAAIVSMAVLAAWFYVDKKRKKSSGGSK